VACLGFLFIGSGLFSSASRSQLVISGSSGVFYLGRIRLLGDLWGNVNMCTGWNCTFLRVAAWSSINFVKILVPVPAPGMARRIGRIHGMGVRIPTGRILEQFEGKMFLPALQHVEGLAECKITHDIEAVEVEPETRIDGLVGEIV
jgi:hypothetical protein